MRNEFRESKYLNESGSKTGNWFMNRLDYFQFHEYPKYKRHKYISLLFGVFLAYLSLKISQGNLLGALPFIYLSYVSLLSFNLLRTKICRYRGYFFYPKRIVKFLRTIEVETDLDDFDSVATMSKK